MNEAVNVSLKRTAELCAIFTIGNGIVGLVQPERHLNLWTSEVPTIDCFVAKDRERSPAQRRLIGLLQVGAGLLLASRLKQGR